MNNNQYYSKYQEIVGKLENHGVWDVDSINNELSSDILDANEPLMEASVYAGYYKYLLSNSINVPQNNNPDDNTPRETKETLQAKCVTNFNAKFTDDVIKANLKDIFDPNFLSLIIVMAGDKKIKSIWEVVESEKAAGHIDQAEYDTYKETLNRKGVLAHLTDKELGDRYKGASTDLEKEKVGKKIDSLSAESLDDAIEDFNQDRSARKQIDFDKEKILRRTEAEYISTPQKKVVMNFEIDENYDAKRRNGTVLTISKKRFGLLRKAIRKYMNWLEKTDVKLEKMVSPDGEVVTVKVKSGDVYNLTATCANVVKDIINNNVDRIQHCQEHVENPRSKVAKALKSVFGKPIEKLDVRRKILQGNIEKKIIAPLGKRIGDKIPSIPQISTRAEQLEQRAEESLEQNRERLARLRNQTPPSNTDDDMDDFDIPPDLSSGGMHM